MMVESLEYKVVKRFGDLEIRRYPEITLATVRGHDDDDAFGILFSFIQGSNSGRVKISMTSPVLSSEYRVDEDSEPAPRGRPRTWFSFAMPAGSAPDSVPRPSDGRIEIETLSRRYVAALRFSGRARPRDVSVMVQKLLFATRYAGLTPKGFPFLMRYNSPFMPGFLRRNEVAMEISYPR